MNGRHLAECLVPSEYSMDVPVCDTNSHCESAFHDNRLGEVRLGRWQGPRVLIEWQNQLAGQIPLLTEYR